MMASCDAVLGTNLVIAFGSCLVNGGLTLIVATAVLALKTVSANDFRLGLILTIRLVVAIFVLCMT